MIVATASAAAAVAGYLFLLLCAWALCRTNRDGLQTWRLPLPPLTDRDHEAVRRASLASDRARRFRAARASHQLALAL